MVKLAPTIFLPVLTADDKLPVFITTTLAFHLVGIIKAGWLDIAKHDVLFLDVEIIPDGDEGAHVTKKHSRIQR